MLSEIIPFVERLVMAVECISYEVENISLHMRGMSHSLHDLNMNVSNLLKGKTEADISTLSGTDLLAESPAADQVTAVEDQQPHQYRDENEELISQNDAMRSEQSSGNTPFTNLIGNEEGHCSNVLHCDEPRGSSSTSKYTKKIKTETRDEENDVLLNVDSPNSNCSNSMGVAAEIKDESIDITEDWFSSLGNTPICTSITTKKKTDHLAEPSKLLQRIGNSIAKGKSAVYSANAPGDAPVRQSKDQASMRDLSQNINDSRRKHMEAFKSTTFVASSSNTMETRKEDYTEGGPEESEEVLRETENVIRYTYVREDSETALAEDNAWKEREQGFLKPSSSLGQRRGKSYQKKLFCCETCGKCFPFNVDFKRHQRVHTGEKPFKCSLCNKPFALKCNLVHHMRVHSSEKLFSCNICERAYKYKHDLDRHKRVHSGERPFQCRQCGKTFTRRCHLIGHLQTHSRKRLFPCANCEMCFTDLGNLNIHRLQVHKLICL